MDIKCNLEQRKKAITNLKKARGQLANVISMLEDEKSCIDVMQQNLAIVGLLKSAQNTILAAHIDTCFENIMREKKKCDKQMLIDEIIAVSKLYNR